MLGRDFLLDAELAARIERLDGVVRVRLSVVAAAAACARFLSRRIQHAGASLTESAEGRDAMLGGMQDWPLRIMRILDHAAREHGTRELVSL